MVRNEARDEGSKKIDLEKVAKLIDALERDLAKVQSGSRDVQLLRDEVETLKNVLNSPIRRPHWVREGLHGMRQAIENGLETIVADGLKASQTSRRSRPFAPRCGKIAAHFLYPPDTGCMAGLLAW